MAGRISMVQTRRTPDGSLSGLPGSQPPGLTCGTFGVVARLELMAVLVAVMLFVRDASWRDGRRRVVLPAYTDNLSNMHVLRKFGSSRYPLSIVAMELAS